MERVCVCMCAQCHFPRSGLDFGFFLLQLISRVQNHEGFCQEEVLGQVKTEHKVAGGVAWPLVLVPSRSDPPPPTSVPWKEQGGHGEGKQNQSKCQPRKCPRLPTLLFLESLLSRTNKRNVIGSLCL